MPKLVHSSWFMVHSLLLVVFLLSTNYYLSTTSYARTTPADILNAQKDAYNQKLQSFSPAGKQKVEEFDKKVAKLNKDKTDYLENLLERQGQILEEYISRTGADPRYETDGIKRNLENDVENARYWLTYAHEAVAFQAAKVYIFNLTSEANMKSNINSTINALENDLSVLRGKVIKSQNIISDLVTK